MFRSRRLNSLLFSLLCRLWPDNRLVHQTSLFWWHSKENTKSKNTSGEERTKLTRTWVWRLNHSATDACRLSTHFKHIWLFSKLCLLFLDVWDMIQREKYGFDHINRNAPVLIWTPKLTRFEPAQYWGGTTVWCWIHYFYSAITKKSWKLQIWGKK